MERFGPFNEGLVNVTSRCFVNGMPVDAFPYDYYGVIIQTYWPYSSGNTSVLSGGPVQTSNANGNFQRTSFNWSGGTLAYGGPEQIVVKCMHDYNGTGLPIFTFGSMVGAHASGIWSPSVIANITSSYGISVIQPGPITGTIGRSFESPFVVKSSMNTMSLTWDIAEPCNSWSPVLFRDGAPDVLIEPGTNGILNLGLGNNQLVGRFTPSAAGAFTCVATLTATSE